MFLYWCFIDFWLILNCIWGHSKVGSSVLNSRIIKFSKSVLNRPENVPKPSQNHVQTKPSQSSGYFLERFWNCLCMNPYMIASLENWQHMRIAVKRIFTGEYLLHQKNQPSKRFKIFWPKPNPKFQAEQNIKNFRTKIEPQNSGDKKDIEIIYIKVFILLC